MNSILIAAGVYLSAKLIAFIAGELTDSERQKQAEIDAEIKKIQRQAKENNPNKGSETTTYCESEAANVEKPVRKQPSIYSFLFTEVAAREEEYKALHKEICESLSTVLSVIKSKTEVHTPLRKNSLELLYRQLCEAKEKCYGYQVYLQIYKEQISLAKNDDCISIFWMQLPAAYPYIGKVIWLNSDQLTESPTIKYKLPDSALTLNIQIEDIDVQKYYEHQIVPVMITNSRWKSFSASIEKGMFKAHELRNTHLGVTATVKKILTKPNRIILTYQKNLELCLPCNNLIKANRYPLIRTTITVYPVYWNYYLSSTHKNSNEKTIYPVTVSEKREDASSSLSFQSFPICFTEEGFAQFTDFYKSNNLQDYNKEFLIGPIDEDNVVLRKGAQLKLQFGDIPLCILSVEESYKSDDQNRFHLRYDRLCNGLERTFSADDIFLPFEVSITPYFFGTTDKTLQEYTGISNLDDVSSVIWDLFEEFRIQNKIKQEREGAGYFFKWESITNQLIAVLEQSEPFLLDIKWIPAESRNSISAEIVNSAELRRFIQSFTKRADLQLMQEWQPEFFIKDDQGNHYEADIKDYGQRIKIRGKHVLDLFHEKTNQIELFASNQPYAEYQQKNALRQFRIGQVVNPQIQAACLNGSSIISNLRDDCTLAPFHNKDLYNNPTQCAAIEHGFREKNIYLIQGPPGSGKTTVIREIIEQVFADNPEARILVVSQANVAVDTALEELIDQHDDQIVRCGIGNKISSKLQKMRLQTRCQEYLDALHQRKSSFDNSFYESWESAVYSNDSYRFSPVLCELIIRSHHLIGATCVGLAKRNIGLERVEFDLVIIDEAGKALPAELLIPLIRAKKAIIIGDQEQLPPVINPILYNEEKIDLEERTISENELFTHSFFERLYNSTPETNKIMLNTQFRMPAVIGDAVSQLFYGKTLKNGIGTEHRNPVLLNANLNFINFDNDKCYFEKKENNSITNEAEAAAVVALVQHIREKDPTCQNRIAVITPYKGQKWLICNKLLGNQIDYQKQKIFIDTIDSFQGSQAEVVIYCCTRAQKPTSFFKDSRRLNVALSRVRKELIILGKLGYFYKKYYQTDSKLPQLADYIKSHGNIIDSEGCRYLHYSNTGTQQSAMLILPIEQIALPEQYFLEEISSAEITTQIDKYDELGYFLDPLVVKKAKGAYELVDGFAQYKAAQEMGLTGCICIIQ